MFFCGCEDFKNHATLKEARKNAITHTLEKNFYFWKLFTERNFNPVINISSHLFTLAATILGVLEALDQDNNTIRRAAISVFAVSVLLDLLPSALKIRKLYKVRKGTVTVENEEIGVCSAWYGAGLWSTMGIIIGIVGGGLGYSRTVGSKKVSSVLQVIAPFISDMFTTIDNDKIDLEIELLRGNLKGP